MIDISLIKHLSRLSKISFDECELADITRQMSDIIQLMDKVKEFDSSEKEYRLCPQKYENLRQDTAAESYDRELILKNSDNVSAGRFSVPKVV